MYENVTAKDLIKLSSKPEEIAQDFLEMGISCEEIELAGPAYEVLAEAKRYDLITSVIRKLGGFDLSEGYVQPFAELISTMSGEDSPGLSLLGAALGSALSDYQNGDREDPVFTLDDDYLGVLEFLVKLDESHAGQDPITSLEQLTAESAALRARGALGSELSSDAIRIAAHLNGYRSSHEQMCNIRKAALKEFSL